MAQGTIEQDVPVLVYQFFAGIESQRIAQIEIGPTSLVLEASQLYFMCVPGQGACLTPAHIATDPIQPGRETLWLTQLFQVSPRLETGFLYHIIGHIRC